MQLASWTALLLVYSGEYMVWCVRSNIMSEFYVTYPDAMWRNYFRDLRGRIYAGYMGNL